MSREAAFPSIRNLTKGQGAILAFKIAFTFVCFWFLFRHIDVAELRRTLPGLVVPWAALAVVLLTLQIPLIGLRWLQIAKVLGMRSVQLTSFWMSVAAAIGQFFGQILPMVVGDGVRMWFLVHFGNAWRNAAMSVVIDRRSEERRVGKEC